MDPLVMVATLSLGLTLSLLRGGPRLGVLIECNDRAGPVSSRAGALTRLRALPGSRWRVGLLAGVVCWLALGQSLATALVGAAAVPLAMAVLGWLEAEPERRRQRVLTHQLPECLELLAAALEAGVPLRAAVGHVAGLVPAASADLLGVVLGHLQVGRSDAQAWQALSDHPVWGPMARDLARCADTGAGVAEILGVHAAEARARQLALRELRARTVSVRSVLPLVSCFLPAFVLVGVVPIIAATIGSLTQGR